jgi:hypothetical protein
VSTKTSTSEDFRKLPILKNGAGEDDGPLNERQQTAVELLALGRSLGTVARTLSIDPRTLYNWRQGIAFRDALHVRRRQLWSTAIERVHGMVNPALDVIEDHLADRRYERIRFRAAQTLLNIAGLKKHATEASEPEDPQE